MTDHKHSYWLDFDNNKVRCSRIGCVHTVEVPDALPLASSDLTLEIAQAKLKDHNGKVYIIRLSGEYLCSVSGYTRGVLHLLDFSKPEYFQQFKEIVDSCFGVNLIQLN